MPPLAGGSYLFHIRSVSVCFNRHRHRMYVHVHADVSGGLALLYCSLSTADVCGSEVVDEF